ncbi:MAG: carboxylesterase [Gammaproteobacteria bacterium]|nr:carboxylesterase [Gammaproteobacteria bacterium]
MTRGLLDAVEIETGSRPGASVIWLHGLGADGNDFEPIVPQLDIEEIPIRFVFPHAPVRPVTLNAGFQMRAWYDIVGIDRSSPQDREGIMQSQADVAALIRRENQRGVETSNIVLAGFSQGGAVALYTGLRYPEKLAGIMGLSTYLPHTEDTADERVSVNHGTEIFMAHGVHDDVVALSLGSDSKDVLLDLGYEVTWKTYPVAHNVAMEEVTDIRRWLEKVLAGKTD